MDSIELLRTFGLSILNILFNIWKYGVFILGGMMRPCEKFLLFHVFFSIPVAGANVSEDFILF